MASVRKEILTKASTKDVWTRSGMSAGCTPVSSRGSSSIRASKTAVL